MPDTSNLQILFGDRELWIGVMDPLTAPVEVIACHTSPSLDAQNPPSRTIHDRIGTSLITERAQLIKEYGEIAPGMAVYTGAGELPYQAIIHTVGPAQGEEQTHQHLLHALTNSLLLCEVNGWASIAFPLLSVQQDDESIILNARAMQHAISHFWDARLDSAVMTIMLCLQQKHIASFVQAFRTATFAQELHVPAVKVEVDSELVSGELDLSNYDPADAEPAIQDWFKS